MTLSPTVGKRTTLLASAVTRLGIPVMIATTIETLKNTATHVFCSNSLANVKTTAQATNFLTVGSETKRRVIPAKIPTEPMIAAMYGVHGPGSTNMSEITMIRNPVKKPIAGP